MHARPTHRPVPLSARRAATLVEAAFVLNVLLVVVIGMLDLALAGLHHNCLAETARILAREAMVHGEKASPARTEWGPETYEGNAADGSELALIVRSVCTPTDHENIAISVEWPDEGNGAGDRVRVELRYAYRPILPFLLGSDAFQLSSVSVMRITH